MKNGDFDALTDRFFDFARARRNDEAVRFFSEHLRVALEQKNEELGCHASHLLISSLIGAGPDEGALTLLWQAVATFSGEPYLRKSFAEFLFSFQEAPEQAFAVLDPVYEELASEEESRHAVLGLRGAILVALGRIREGEDCFRKMIQPSLWKMYPGAFDFRLVESLVTRGLSREECQQYLYIVSQRAQQEGAEDVMRRAKKLLERLS